MELTNGQIVEARQTGCATCCGATRWCPTRRARLLDKAAELERRNHWVMRPSRTWGRVFVCLLPLKSKLELWRSLKARFRNTDAEG